MYIDEFRISSTARWTENFTPPTSAYSNTVRTVTKDTTLLDTVPRGVPLVFDAITQTWVAKLSRINQEDREASLDVARQTNEDQSFLRAIGFQ